MIPVWAPPGRNTVYQYQAGEMIAWYEVLFHKQDMPVEEIL